MNLIFQKEINGKKTYFKRKIQAGLLERFSFKFMNENYNYKVDNYIHKIHTIREDKKGRWKIGMNIHFKEWTNKPYRSAMYQFAPIVKVKSIQDIEIKWGISNKGMANEDKYVIVKIDGNSFDINELVKNDGFESNREFFEYFNKDFKGKIIHWTDVAY